MSTQSTLAKNEKKKINKKRVYLTVFRRRRRRRIRRVGTRRVFRRSSTVEKRQEDCQRGGHAPGSGMPNARQRVYL